ncbi:MAG: hypothetical protein E4G96_07455 [Chrysiogenales bacterium]|nr:MAG: hypothetical protein E4G96_07455 [Chrysiogenales bacterium]
MKKVHTRRVFMKKALTVSAGLALSGVDTEAGPGGARIRTTDPKRALVVWFSQTGHTERIGRIVACRLMKGGLVVDSGDIRDFDLKGMSRYDLIVAGSPVYYFEAPHRITAGLESISSIKGTAVASYSTYGGPGHNQHNTAFDLLECLMKKGGAPVGIDSFGNMSTFAPTWSSGRVARIVKYKNLPNEATYARARNFADRVLASVRAEKVVRVKREITPFEAMKALNSRWWTKRMISRHVIDADACIACGLCEVKCPAGAISIADLRVDRDRCVACMGCVNLCPVQAHDMVFNGKRVYGFFSFMRRQGITIKEPAELLGGTCGGGAR